MQLVCVDCKQTFEARRKDTQRCDICKRKHKSLIVMRSRQKKHPEIELGVGSGKAKNNLPGPTNQSWKTGIVGYHKLVEKKECAQCGRTEHLHIHHKDENRHNNKLENLVVLCAKCHRRLHSKRCPITGQYLAK